MEHGPRQKRCHGRPPVSKANLNPKDPDSTVKVSFYRVYASVQMPFCRAGHFLTN